jgi:hypothetical protein
VVAGDESVVIWPSTNGPTPFVALDALEAELRELLGGAGVTPMRSVKRVPFSG